MAKITKEMTFGDVLSSFPEAGEVMMKYGLHCIGCHVAAYESIEQGCLAHGLTEKQITEMLKELNDLAEKKKKN